MPQTYMRGAAPAGPLGCTPCRAESYNAQRRRRCRAARARRGRDPGIHGRQPSDQLRRRGAATRHGVIGPGSGSHRRPGHRRPVLRGCGNAGVAAAGRPGGRRRPTSPSVRCSASASPSAPASCPAQLREHLHGLGAAAARRPSPTARCAACPRRGSRPRGRRRRPGRRRACSTWPPLRSALLSTASSTASRASRGSSACASSVRPAVVVPGRGDRQPARRQLAGGHEADQRLGVRPARPPTAGRRPARAGRRAARSAAPGPSRWPPRPGRRRPRGRPGCRRGSPTAAARRGPACRRSGPVHAVQGDDAAQRRVGGVHQPALAARGRRRRSSATARRRPSSASARARLVD